MDLRGVSKLSLLDYPEKVACTVFTGGCNLRCPFCHNPSLVLPERLQSEPPTTSVEAFLAFLDKRRGILDGVCITGGEPLMQPDLEAFIRQIRKRGFLVKLDTNGTFPDGLERLIEAGLLDYVAMDIKNSLERYPQTVGIFGFSTEGVVRSLQLLKEGRVPYEFRTTVVRQLHGRTDLMALAQCIAGARSYVLQHFVDSGDLVSNVLVMADTNAAGIGVGTDADVGDVFEPIPTRLTGYTAQEMEALRDAVRPWVPSTVVRGV